MTSPSFNLLRLRNLEVAGLREESDFVPPQSKILLLETYWHTPPFCPLFIQKYGHV
jgi:hypothetical protein